MEELTVKIALGPAPFVGFAILLFLRNLVMAPSRMERKVVFEADNRIEAINAKLTALLEENARLTEECIPRISAVAHTGLHMLGMGTHLMWAELEVENTSPTQPLMSTQVRVVTCEHIAPPSDNTEVFKNLGNYMWDWSPITLLWTQSDSDAMDIPGGVSRTVLVAFSDNPNGPPAVFNDSVRTHCPLELKIMVEISSPSSAALHGSYFIQCHPNYTDGTSARFEFMSWEEWASTHTVIDVDVTGSELDTSDFPSEGVC